MTYRTRRPRTYASDTKPPLELGVRILFTTDKAYKVDTGLKSTWLPKSKITILEHNTETNTMLILVPQWLIKSHELA